MKLVPTTGTLKITDPAYQGQAITITQEFADGSKKVITGANDTVAKDGTFTAKVAQSTLRPMYTIHIGPAAGGNTWAVLGDGTKLGANGRPDGLSFEERKAADAAKGMQGNLGGAPLDVASSLFFSEPGERDYMLEVANQSPTTAYGSRRSRSTRTSIFSLTPALFNSPQAIATERSRSTPARSTVRGSSFPR